MNRIVVFIFCVCFINGKDIAVQSQIMINRNSRQDLNISSCESLVSYDLQNLLTFLAQFLQIYVQRQFNFYPTGITWRNGAGSVCLKPLSMNRDVCIHYDVSLPQRIGPRWPRRKLRSKIKFINFVTINFTPVVEPDEVEITCLVS